MYRLKEAREAAGKSQMQAAIATDTTQQQISKWERQIQDITLGKAIKLAKYYNVSLDYLAGMTGLEQEQENGKNCSKD